MWLWYQALDHELLITCVNTVTHAQIQDECQNYDSPVQFVTQRGWAGTMFNQKWVELEMGGTTVWGI